MWQKYSTCDVSTAQCEDGTIKCEKKKNKGTTECDKSTVTCDVGTTQCNDGTIICEKIREPPNVIKYSHMWYWYCTMWGWYHQIWEKK